MPFDFNIPPEISKHLAGTLGSLSALLWVKDTWPRRISMVFAGIAFSYFVAPMIAQWADLQPELSGYLTGLFGMAAVNKVFATWDVLDFGSMLKRWLHRRFDIGREDKDQ